MLAQVFMCGVGKKAPVHEAADDREGALERCCECRNEVVAVYPQPSLRAEPVPFDSRDELWSVDAEHGASELQLQLKQAGHIGEYWPALARAVPRPAGRRVREDWCPTRSRLGPGRTA